MTTSTTNEKFTFFDDYNAKHQRKTNLFAACFLYSTHELGFLHSSRIFVLNFWIKLSLGFYCIFSYSSVSQHTLAAWIVVTVLVAVPFCARSIFLPILGLC